MKKLELKKKIEEVLDLLVNPCERCADDDFKPSDCEHFHPDWEKEGRITFCDLQENTPLEQIMDFVEQYSKGK